MRNCAGILPYDKFNPELGIIFPSIIRDGKLESWTGLMDM